MRWGLYPRRCLFVTEQSGHSVLLTHFFGLTWFWGERFPPDCMCFLLLSVFVKWSLVCYFVHWWSAFYTYYIGVSWMDIFKRNASHNDSSKLMEAFYALSSVVFNSFDCSCCCGYQLQTSASPVDLKPNFNIK